MSEAFDVRIITASYRREPVDGPEEGQVPVIQLVGRTREGKSIAVEYSGFKPYFFVVAPPQALRGAFARDKQVVSFEDVTLEVEGRPTPCARVTLRQPWKTPEYREKARKFGSTPLEADIPFQHRFIYDMDLGAAVRIIGTPADPAGRYTTELFVVAERFEPCDPFRPALRILSFDIENSIRDGHIFCIGVAYREGGEIKTRILTGNEKEIIERFVKLIWELDPDIISGYNIDGYDLPVLVERSAKHGMQRLQLARDHSSFFHLGERFWRLDGRILTDVWWAVRAEMRPKQETLDYVAKHLLGVGKHELQRRKIDEEWEADRDKVIRYCINDAELSLKILERVRRIEKTLDLAAVSKLPLEDVLHGRTSNLIDSILIRAADRAHVAVPMMKMRGGRVEQIEGGYVHSLQPGLYEWVISLDFRAMYPSLIIENNICFTTVSPNGTIASPTGAKFLAADRSKGIIGELEAEQVKVVYADTDSVFFQSPSPGPEESLAFARKTAERFSRGRISMEVDKIYETLFSHGRKKRYAGKVAWPQEMRNEMVVRGYEIRRTDAFDLQSEAQGRVFEKILDRDQDGSIALAKQIVSEVRAGTPTLEDPDRDPIEALVISRTVKEENRYVNPNSMSNVIAARKLEEMGEEFMPGMKVSWIVTDSKKSPMEVEPYVSGRPFDQRPDWEYYARRVAQTLAYITEVYGWDEKALFTGTQPAQQKSLDSGDFAEHETPSEGPRRAEKKMTLEDYF